MVLNLILGWKLCCFLSLGDRIKHNLVFPLDRKVEFNIIVFFFMSLLCILGFNSWLHKEYLQSLFFVLLLGFLSL